MQFLMGVWNHVQSSITLRVLDDGPLVCSDGPEKMADKYDCVDFIKIITLALALTKFTNLKFSMKSLTNLLPI